MNVLNRRAALVAGALIVLLSVAANRAGTLSATPTCDEDCRVTCVYMVLAPPAQPVALNYAYASASPCGSWHYSNSEYHYYVVDGPTLEGILKPTTNSALYECAASASPPAYYKYTGSPACGSTGSYVAGLCYECSDIPVGG